MVLPVNRWSSKFLKLTTLFVLHDFRCRDYCIQQGYLYYGVQARDECFCGNNHPDDNRMTDESLCNSNCPADPSVKCGGGCKMNIYLVELLGKFALFDKKAHISLHTYITD